MLEPALDLRVLNGDSIALVANVLNQIGVFAEKGMDRLGVLKVLGNVRRRVRIESTDTATTSVDETSAGE